MSKVIPLRKRIKNTSGCTPVGDRVVVKPDKIEKVSAGGIIMVDNIREREAMAQCQGTLIEYGPAAWNGYNVGKWAEPGDRVLFAKYGGIQFVGNDGETYRLINDIDISAKVDGGFDVARKPAD